MFYMAILCSLCFVGFMFLLLYVFSLLLGGLVSLTQCSQGYISSSGCDADTLMQQVFSGTEIDLAFGFGESTVDLGVDGYAIRNYLAPIEQWAAVSLYGVNVVDDTAPSYGLSVINDRANILWSSLVDTEWYTVNGLQFSTRSPPSSNGADATTSGPNDAQFVAQQNTLTDLLDTATENSCPYYDATTLTGSYEDQSYDVLSVNFSMVYSDAAFACPQCVPMAPEQSPTRIYFDGALWVARTTLQSFDWCTTLSCFTYPYAFINYESSDFNSTNKLLPEATCPAGVGYFTKSPSSEQGQTLQALTYSNLLTNSLLDPWLRSDPVQGGFTSYGTLFFDAQLISEAQAFWMVLFGMMLMNGFWPMAGNYGISMQRARDFFISTMMKSLLKYTFNSYSFSVWRAGHERSGGLVEMMNTGNFIC